MSGTTPKTTTPALEAGNRTAVSTGRRAVLLGAGAVVALPGVIAPAAASPGPDAELIAAAGAVLEAAHRSVALTCDVVGDFGDELDDEVLRLAAVCRDNLARAIALPARTPAGLRAKAALFREYVEKDFAENLLPQATWCDRIAWSLCDDLTGEVRS